jgi:adenylate cyclase
MAGKETEMETEAFWRDMFENPAPGPEVRRKRIMRFLPSSPRCKLCYAPFGGLGGRLLRVVIDSRPSTLNPTLCNRCENFGREHPGGAEVDLALLFADIRGSTRLAEQLGTSEFTRLINRFYQAATNVLITKDALIEKLIGDEVTGVFYPGMGANYVRRAVETAQELLEATGHTDAQGPWAPLGVGVHSGKAFVGMVGSQTGKVEFMVLGDTANTAARLTSAAKQGEIVVSEAAWEAAGLPLEGIPFEKLELKGRQQSIDVRILRVGDLARVS